MAGVDLKTIQELMGHRTLAMTLRYAHLSPVHKLAAVQRLQREPTGTTTGTDPASDTAPPKAPQGQVRVWSAETGNGGGPDRTADLGIMSPKKLSALGVRSMAGSSVFPLIYGR